MHRVALTLGVVAAFILVAPAPALAAADIDVNTVADSSTVSAGTQIGYVITLANTGADTATGVTFTDTLPSGQTWFIDGANSDAGWSISSGNLQYSPTTVAGSTSKHVHIVANTDAADCGITSNTAAVTSTNAGSDQATAQIDINCGQMDVTKTADAASVSAGTTIGYTVTIANTGDGNATGLTFTDTLPTGLTWFIDAANSDTGWSISTGGLHYAPTTFAAHTSKHVHIIAATDAADCGIKSNTASVTSTHAGSDQAAAQIDINCGQMDVTKTADAASVSAGTTIGYTITIANTGDGNATGLTFTDTLPTGLTWFIDAANSDTGWSISTGGLHYAPTTFAAHTSKHVHIIAATDAADCGIKSNTASVTSTHAGSDQATAQIDINCGQMDVTKTADAASVSAGTTIGYTVTIANTGDGNATGLTFTDTLPTGLTWFIDAANSDTGWSISTGGLHYAPTTFAAHTSKHVHIIAATDAADCGIKSNTASVTSTHAGSDQAAAQIDINCGQMDVTKTADASTVSAGNQIGYTVTIANTGDGSATGLTFTDTLPTGLTWFIDAANSDTGWSISTGQLHYAPTTFAAQTSKHVHITANTSASNCGLISNTASVSTSNAGSDQATAQITVTCPPAAPTNLTATAGAAREVVLEWTPPINTGGSPLTGYNVYRSAVAGQQGGLVGLAPPGATWTDTAPTDGLYYYRVQAVNALGPSPSSNQAAANADGTPPQVTVTAPARLFSLSDTATVKYSAVDVAGISTYDVRYRVAPWDGGFGAYQRPSAWQHVTATSRSRSVTPGHEYCFSVRARDALGNVSGWSPDRCVVSPLDDRALTRDADWTRKSVDTAYQDTLTQSTERGAKLTLAGMSGMRLALVVTTCATCGRIGVYVDGSLWRSPSTYSASTRARQLIVLPAFGLQTATVVLKAAGGGKVIVDGLGISRT